MAGPPSSLLVAAGVVAGALLLAVGVASSSSKSTKSTDLVEIDDEILNGGDYITEDDVVKIFDSLFLQMQQVVAQLSNHIQELRMQGGQIPEAQLRHALKQEFDRALATKQPRVFAEFGIDEACLEEATWEFLEQENKRVKASVERFQRLYETITGESVVGKRPGEKGGGSSDREAELVTLLPPDKLVEAAQVYFEALTDAMRKCVGEFEGRDLKEMSVAQELHMKFASVANDAGEKALMEKEISLVTFKASIEAHSSNPTVGRTLAMLQMKQQQEMMAMGVPT